MRRIAAGFFACAAPDLDFVTGFAGPVSYLENHRGVTHSLILLPLWAAGLAQDPGQQPRERERPVRQQDQRVRDAAVVLEIGDRTRPAGDEIEVRCGAGEKTRGDAPRQRARRRVLARCRAPEQRTGQRVR